MTKNWKIAASATCALLLLAVAVLVGRASASGGNAPAASREALPAVVTPSQTASATESVTAAPATPSADAPNTPSTEAPPTTAPETPAPAEPPPESSAVAEQHECPVGYLNVREGKVSATALTGDLYAVEYQGTLVNNTSADVFLNRDDPPDVYAVDANGETVTILSQGQFLTRRTDGAPVESRFVLPPGRSVAFSLKEDSRVMDRRVANWYDIPRLGSMTAEWNEAADYRCASPLRPGL